MAETRKIFHRVIIHNIANIKYKTIANGIRVDVYVHGEQSNIRIAVDVTCCPSFKLPDDGLDGMVSLLTFLLKVSGL